MQHRHGTGQCSILGYTFLDHSSHSLLCFWSSCSHFLVYKVHELCSGNCLPSVSSHGYTNCMRMVPRPLPHILTLINSNSSRFSLSDFSDHKHPISTSSRSSRLHSCIYHPHFIPIAYVTGSLVQQVLHPVLSIHCFYQYLFISSCPFYPFLYPQTIAEFYIHCLMFICT